MGSSSSDYTFAKVIDDVNRYVAASIHEKTTQLQSISLTLAILIFGALVTFVSSHIREIVHDQETNKNIPKNSQKR